MNLVKHEKGFSLIEVIVAVSILLIIISAFSLLFTNSFSGIFTAGRQSRSLFQAQEEIDNAIAGGTGNSGGDILVVNFDYRTVEIDGQEIIINYEYEGRSNNLYYFLPE